MNRTARVILLLLGGGVIIASTHEEVMKNEHILLTMIIAGVALIWSAVRDLRNSP